MNVIFKKIGLIIFQGSVATNLRCGEQYYMSYVANFVSFLAVKNFEDRLNYGQAIES